MATSRALETVGCPYHNDVPSEVIARTDGMGLAHWAGKPGHPEWEYVIALCVTGHRFARVVDIVKTPA